MIPTLEDMEGWVVKHERKLIEDLIATLRQGLELVEIVSDEVYVEPLPSLKASSLGAHYRHHLDHVRSVLVGVESGRVDYDDRVRGTDIEFDRCVAGNATRELIEGLRRLCNRDLNQPCVVVQRSCASADGRPEGASTLMRELAFLQSHAIHHYAMMGLLVRAHGLEVPDGFGLMPSTINYQLGDRSPCAQAAPQAG